ncbi:hypothetical protein T265_04953 [Opisthorchis viverrini]|uniref:Uncharacterized protein n=1 Tax=Opisthorchis viverrini TaxID=6198 RepID=A0A074ZMC2_OPIVI|nr:hypothetical protein T265_04953 [Opisthorchis viverrini]KER28201.1 hypothetical protein T265_04953 [Opisthorchis viverrini]
MKKEGIWYSSDIILIIRHNKSSSGNEADGTDRTRHSFYGKPEARETSRVFITNLKGSETSNSPCMRPGCRSAELEVTPESYRMAPEESKRDPSCLFCSSISTKIGKANYTSPTIDGHVDLG